MIKIFKITFYIFLVVLFCSCVNSGQQNKESEPQISKPRIVNIINFIRLCEPRKDEITEDVLYETVQKQVDILNQYKLGGTFLLQYDALMNARYQKLLKSLPADSFEIGAWWEIPQPLVEKAGYEWRGRYSWDWHADVGFATGYSPEEREKLVDVYMKDFKQIFGYYPKSVGSWFIDAHTLNYLHEKYGIVASCNCKDQVGTDGYSMWGGYWNQGYYPSKKNAYVPAQNAENQIPVPIFRMLGSDPVRQYDNGLGTKKQKVVSLEPVYPESGGDAAWINWYFNQFVDGECMEYAFVQAGQENSFTWKRMAKGYELQIPLIAKLRDQKKVKLQTLAESGQWFRENYKTTPATSVTVMEDFNGSNNKTVWINSRYYRANLLWQDNTLRFRDIHVFDESLESNYLTKKTTSSKCDYYALPVVDGYNWSTVEEIAGLRFKAIIDGEEKFLEGGTPEVDGSEKGQLFISWPLVNSKGTLVFEMDEEGIEIKMTGNNKLNWFLDMTAKTDAALPFKNISSDKIECNFKGMDYSVSVCRGTLSVPGKSSVFKIFPEEKLIRLSFIKTKSALD
uniref:hypothetical protein n=1 Tax=uncultured Draconibacterium sp. TaxID=1573823 RepID=UPI0032168F9A